MERESNKPYSIVFYEDDISFYTLNGLLFMVEDVKIKSRFLLLNVFGEEKISWKRKFVIHDPLISRLFLFIEFSKNEISQKDYKIKFIKAAYDEDIFKASINLFEPLFFYNNIFYFGLFYFKNVFGKNEGIIVYKKSDIELNKNSRYLMLTENGKFIFNKGIDRVLPFVPIIWLKSEL